MELERVLPQLHLVKKSGVVANDWQTHLEQFKQHRRSIEKCFAESREHLKHLEEGLLRDINKISNREKYINSQVKDALEDYGHAQVSIFIILQYAIICIPFILDNEWPIKY